MPSVSTGMNRQDTRPYGPNLIGPGEPLRCPKTCPRHRQLRERSPALSPKPTKTVQYSDLRENVSLPTCGPCQKDREQCHVLCENMQRYLLSANQSPAASVAPLQNQTIPENPPEQKRNHVEVIRSYPSQPDCTLLPGDLKDVCQAYQQLQCKDTVWTVKIMKDAANSTSIRTDVPVTVQTSLTTIITATKLETLLPINERFIIDEYVTSHGDSFGDSHQRYVECSPCAYKDGTYQQQTFYQPPAFQATAYSRSDTPRTSGESSPAESSTCCGLRTTKKKKRRRKYPVPRDLMNNCTENYIS